jgi:hypothetical protein
MVELEVDKLEHGLIELKEREHHLHQPQQPNPGLAVAY